LRGDPKPRRGPNKICRRKMKRERRRKKGKGKKKKKRN